MGVPILILGESGTGKTTSLRNFKDDEIAIVNVAGKPLPFRGKFETLSKTTSYREIEKFIKSTKAKRIIVDDCQYIMSFQYMRRIKENGWDKFNEIQSDFFNLIDLVSELPDDVIVYFLSHLETRDDGRQKIKTIGKMLDEKITIEGMFTTVLKTYVTDGKYFFLTQNSGNDTVKSPLGMFNSFAIDNDLKYVDDKIRNYYQIGEFKTDDEMAVEDKKVENTEIEKASNGRIKRTPRNTSTSDESNEVTRKSRVKRDEVLPGQLSIDDQVENQASEAKTEETAEEAPRQRRTRKQRDSFQPINDENIPF